MKRKKDLKIPFNWEERRPVLLDKFFYVPAVYEHVPKEFLFFSQEPKRPILIEYCSGNGQWIAERAQQNPHIDWIAVEKRFDRARTIWLKIQRENIPNLVVACSEALIFTKYYAPKVEEVYINFPDPWPKRRHSKHRLISLAFLEELLLIVAPLGRVTCVTDHEDYAREMKDEFAKCPNWKFLFNVNEWPDYGRSFFKDLWLQRGRTINYLSYEKNG
jgi:tRNA (guanine-N7-)-methyltransferase